MNHYWLKGLILVVDLYSWAGYFDNFKPALSFKWWKRRRQVSLRKYSLSGRKLHLIIGSLMCFFFWFSIRVLFEDIFRCICGERYHAVILIFVKKIKTFVTTFKLLGERDALRIQWLLHRNYCLLILNIFADGLSDSLCEVSKLP